MNSGDYNYGPYNAWKLLEIVEKANPPDYEYDCFGEESFSLDNGWRVVLFYDIGELDCINEIITPEGKVIDFWEWPDCPVKDVMKSWRGVGDLKRLKEEFNAPENV